MRCQQNTRRSGVIKVLTVILLVVILGCVAFAIDVGVMALARTELQAAADAGALSGAEALLDSPHQARQESERFAELHNVLGDGVGVIRHQDIELGTWDTDTREFTPLPWFHWEKATSVQVTCRCDESRGNSVSLFFARIFDRDNVNVAASAIATREPVCGTFIGLEWAKLNGNGARTDSYNSLDGPYNSQIPGAKGHVCSNGDINVQNGAVNGNAMPGPGHSVELNQGSVTGTTKPRTSDITLQPVKFGPASSHNDNDLLSSPPFIAGKKEFKLNDGEYTLPPGTYYFEDFSVGAQAAVRVEGPTTIYVKGDVALAGGSIMNVTQLPGNLKILAEGKSVKVSGHSDFYGYVYAPASEIEVTGGAGFYGGAAGRTLSFHNDGGIHADQALSLIEGVPTRSILVR